MRPNEGCAPEIQCVSGIDLSFFCSLWCLSFVERFSFLRDMYLFVHRHLTSFCPFESRVPQNINVHRIESGCLFIASENGCRNLCGFMVSSQLIPLSLRYTVLLFLLFLMINRTLRTWYSVGLANWAVSVWPIGVFIAQNINEVTYLPCTVVIHSSQMNFYKIKYWFFGYSLRTTYVRSLNWFCD